MTASASAPNQSADLPEADDVVRQLARIATSGISDALDRLGIAGQAFDVFPVYPAARTAGRAFTGLYQPVDVDGGTVGDYIDDVPPGSVIVLDNGGRTDATVWGDILTLVASRRGIAGTVIDGVCRDTSRSVELDYPVFARGRWMRTGKDRVQMVAKQVPVTIGRVRVRPGDIVIGDGDGVVVVPRDREREVLAAVLAIEETEAHIRARLDDGVSLREARSQLGYHTLQTRTADDQLSQS